MPKKAWEQGLETPLARHPHQITCQYYDMIAGKMLSPIRATKPAPKTCKSTCCGQTQMAGKTAVQHIQACFASPTNPIKKKARRPNGVRYLLAGETR